MTVASNPKCRLSLLPTPHIDCGPLNRNNSIRVYHRYFSPHGSTTEAWVQNGFIQTQFGKTALYLDPQRQRVFEMPIPQVDHSMKVSEYGHIVNGRYHASMYVRPGPTPFWSIPLYKNGLMTAYDNTGQIWCLGRDKANNNSVVPLKLPHNLKKLVTDTIPSGRAPEAPDCEVFNMHFYDGSIGQDKCWVLDDNGQASWVVDADGSGCDQFILEPFTGTMDSLVPGEVRRQVVGAPFDTLVQLVKSWGAFETRLQLEANEQVFCLAFGPNEQSAAPVFYRARCALTRQQIFYRTANALFVIIPVQGTDRFELIKLRNEVTPDDDTNSKVYVVPETIKPDQKPTEDRCVWNVNDKFGSMSVLCNPMFVKLFRPESGNNGRCSVSIDNERLACNPKAQGLDDVFHVEHIHSCDKKGNCEVTLSQAKLQRRVIFDGGVAADNGHFLVPQNTFARSRWTLPINAAQAGTVTRSDKIGNQFCWKLNMWNFYSIYPTRVATKKNFAQQTLGATTRKTISVSECDKFEVLKATAENTNSTLPKLGLCVQTEGNDAFLVRNSHNSKDCESVRFVPLADENMVGSIVAYPSGLCLSYQASDTPARSSLQLATCDPDQAASQTFMYGRFSGRLRAVTTAIDTEAFANSTEDRRNEINAVLDDPTSNPVLFFWWRSSIRAYPTLPAEFATSSQHYAWDLNADGDVSPILARDIRGYSGACLAYASDAEGSQVFGSQQCSLFRFQPLNPPPKQPLSGSIRIKIQIGAEISCMTQDLGFAACNNVEFPTVLTFASVQQIVMISSSSEPCDGAACDSLKVKLAAGVGPQDAIMWASPPNVPNANRDLELGAWKDVAEPYWTVSFKKFGPIRAADGSGGCWVWRGRLVVSTTEPCASFLVEPFYESVNLPRSVIPISGFHERFMARYKGRSRLLNYGYAPLATWEFRGSSFFVNADGSMMLNSQGNARTALLLPMTVPRQTVDDSVDTDTLVPPLTGIQLPWKETAEFTQPPKFGLITVRFASYILDPPKAASYLIMSNLKHSGCLVYITSGSRFGVECYNNGQKISSCISNVIEYRYKPGAFRPTTTWGRYADLSVSLLYSTQAGVNSTLFLGGHEILSCPTPESWTRPAAEFIQFFDDPSQWRYQTLPAYVKHASFFESPTRDGLVTTVRNMVDPFQDWRSQAAPIQPSQWTNCTDVSVGDRLVSLRCQVAVPAPLDINCLSLACSRPNCTVRIVSEAPLIVEYRPNYPDQFNSESVGTSIDLPDVAYLTDGFSLHKFQADMKFRSAPTNARLELAQATTQHDAAEVGDLFKYMLKQSFCCIRPAVAIQIEEELF
eukprot:TRINITY_DN4629_c0_g1_i2.p1 TRINITY_DN4629_c0_g1~~TRINITY_DN4629_c0_g1_i2.p1  ORF type:complete len:1495 (-),score=424.64 TRINITY_DN4629_c0_g1_i2:100-4065(-)